MRKVTATTLTLLAAIVAIAAPVLAAIYQARRQGLDAATARALSYAHDVLHRTDATAVQIERGFDQIAQAGQGGPCSDASISAMRDVDVGSSYIQAVGYVSNDRFVCSSLGRIVDGLPIGPVDSVTSAGIKVRANVQFPFSAGVTFIVVERDHLAAIIHKDLPIDATTGEENVSLAAFLTDDKRILTARGHVDPAWLVAARDGSDATFVEGGFVVAVVPSTMHFVGAIAALPVADVNQLTRAAALLLVPIGLAGGLLLAFAVVHLARLQLALPAVLKAALRRREFFLAYQPIVDLRTGTWTGAEVLIRWRRPSGEMVRPDLFIPAAEDAGLMERVTARVIELAARDAAELFARFPDFALSVNLSAADLHSTHTVALLQRLIRESHAGPTNLIIEVTERGLLEPDAAKNSIRALRANAIRVAIDDFGTGFSSLSYLGTFELDFLKIDKAFVDALGTEAPTSRVALTIIEMGKALNLELIAEGIETAAQAEFLRDHGVHYGQGWLFDKSMSFVDLADKLSDRARARQN